jgi:tetratricopeptide (TPR) repeat protein
MATKRAAVAFTALALLLGRFVFASNSPGMGQSLESAISAYNTGDYSKAIQLLQAAAGADSSNAEVFLWMSKSFYQMKEFEKASDAGEKAVGLDPKNSSVHEWLGRSYGERADRASWFSAISLAKKARKEFAIAVSLDERNFSAQQALVEFDCAAPGIVGGGEDKAIPTIEKIASLDEAEGHYARGNCHRQKKRFDQADLEFTKTLQLAPKSADLIYDIGDYAMKRDQADRLIAVVQAGTRVAPSDPRGPFYSAVSDILRGEHLPAAESAIRNYLDHAPRRANYPSPSMAHYWLGRMFERKGDLRAAASEYETAIRLDAKNRYASDALKRVK